MIYIFDTNSFIVLGHYFPDRFPSFWERFNAAIAEGDIVSVREVFKELEGRGNRPHLQKWIESNKEIFLIPSPEEMKFVGEIFKVPHFRDLVTQKQRLKGTPVADPFVIAAAKIRNGWVVTEEEKKENAAKIPNVCEHFGIECTNLEGFMALQKWMF